MKKRETLGDRVAQLRREKAAQERRDITQKEVAEEMGVSRPVVSETESGKTYPSDTTLAKLARYFGVSEQYLEYGTTASPLDDILAGARKLTDEELARAQEIARRAERSTAKPSAKKKRRTNGGGKSA